MLVMLERSRQNWTTKKLFPPNKFPAHYFIYFLGLLVLLRTDGRISLRVVSGIKNDMASLLPKRVSDIHVICHINLGSSVICLGFKLIFAAKEIRVRLFSLCHTQWDFKQKNVTHDDWQASSRDSACCKLRQAKCREKTNLKLPTTSSCDVSPDLACYRWFFLFLGWQGPSPAAHYWWCHISGWGHSYQWRVVVLNPLWA